MGSKYSSSKRRYQKPFILSLIFLCFLLLIILVVLSSRPRPTISIVHDIQNNLKTTPIPVWFDIIEQEFKGREKIKVGLVNADDTSETPAFELLGLSNKSCSLSAETVSITFDHVDNQMIKWDDLFPAWIDEDQKRGPPPCPKIPMPPLEEYRDLDVIVARVPCGKDQGDDSSTNSKEGIRDVFRLQVNLVVANLVVGSGWVGPDINRTVYVVFVGECEPMVEIFRCDDLIMKQGKYWVYRPELRRLEQKVLMPLGSCQIAPAYARTGEEIWRRSMDFSGTTSSNTIRNDNWYHLPREAYVTVLHSSESYVCGAIALAQSLLQTNTTKDLVLLADWTISPSSIQALISAGWKIVRIDRIKSPYAEKNAYNEFNYSKLRIWQLTDYDKIIFIDSDFIVLKNIDHFFVYPQLSASRNHNWLFNSGLMIVEPSVCMFADLMVKSFSLGSYNGGDQGFLNQVFTWWHRLPARLNSFKYFNEDQKHEMVKDPYAIHYFGLKPWMCYRDYDCNWDVVGKHIFASDDANEKWWNVYDRMPRKLQRFCGLTKKMDGRIKEWRKIARTSGLVDGHWKIQVKDPRRLNHVE